MKCRAPCCHSRCRSLTRKLATIIRTRLCIQPVARSCRMPASTIGKPVRPSCQASSWSPGSSYGIAANSGRRYSRAVSGRCEQHVGVELPPGELRAVGRGALRRCGPARSASIVRGWISPHLRCTDIRLGGVEVGAVAVVVVVGEAARRRTPASAGAPPPRRPRAARARRAASASGRSTVLVERPASSRPVGASTGSRQPCSGQARENGV